MIRTTMTVSGLEKLLLRHRKYKQALRRIAKSCDCVCGAYHPSELVISYQNSAHAVHCPLVRAARALGILKKRKEETEHVTIT